MLPPSVNFSDAASIVRQCQPESEKTEFLSDKHFPALPSHIESSKVFQRFSKHYFQRNEDKDTEKSAESTAAQQMKDNASYELFNDSEKDLYRSILVSPQGKPLQRLWKIVCFAIWKLLLQVFAIALFRVGAIFLQIFALLSLLQSFTKETSFERALTQMYVAAAATNGTTPILTYPPDFRDHLALQFFYAALLAFGTWIQSLSQHNMLHLAWICGFQMRSLLMQLIFYKTSRMTPMQSREASARTYPSMSPSSPSPTKEQHDSKEREGKVKSPAVMSSSSSPASQRRTNISTTGHLINYVSTDSNSVCEAMVCAPLILSTPIEAAIAIGWIWHFVGWAAAVVLGTMLLFGLVQFAIGWKVTNLRTISLRFADRRIRALNEYFSGISVVKYGSWEKHVVKHIEELREAEANVLTVGNTWKLLNLSIFFVVPGCLALVCFGIQNLYNSTMDPTSTFVVYSLLQVIARSFSMVPRGVTSIGIALASVSRIEEFLSLDFVSARAFPQIGLNGDAKKQTLTHAPGEGTPSIRVRGSFGWGRKSFHLRNIHFEAKKGELVVVVGSVGSGKSTLLHTIMGNCSSSGPTDHSPQHEPTDDISGTHVYLGESTVNLPSQSIAYVAQEAWIEDATVRDNILFGSQFNDQRYREVLRVCSLEQDIIQWGGDLVEVGERGVTLSGGQRQRLSLARACYADRDIYLLDDPISAVDASVGRHLLNFCIKQYLKDKFVILVTHHTAPLQIADRVIVLEDGMQVSATSPKSAQLSACHLTEDETPSLSSASETHGSIVSNQATPTSTTVIAGDRASSVDVLRDLLGKSLSVTQIEHNAVGQVSAAVHAEYIKSGGIFLLLVFSTTVLLAQAFRNAGEWWFSAWTSRKYSMSASSYILINLALVGGTAIFAVVRAFTYGRYTLRASSALHNKMFFSVLFSPLHFFESVPLGRIMNRFSKDVDNADDLLARTSFDFISLVGVAFGSIALLIVSIPWFAIAFVVLGLLFLKLTKYYLPASRNLKRVEGASRSPSLQWFQVSLQGMSTIRAYGRLSFFAREFAKRIDCTSRATIANDRCQRWVGTRMDWITVTVVLIISTLSVILISVVRRTNNRLGQPGATTEGLSGGLSPSLAGLALAQSLMLTGLLQFSVRMAAETEALMTSVERLVEYGSLPSEPQTTSLEGKSLPIDEDALRQVGHHHSIRSGAAAATSGKLTPSSGLMICGEIELKNFSVAHVSNPTGFVLRDLSLRIPQGQKVAVVGRTGAGKSTLLSCFFRMLPIAPGSIFIDTVDITQIPLQHLRGGLGIIPQAPTLFQGSLRRNVDPFDEFTDEEVWKALCMVQLDKYLLAENRRETLSGSVVCATPPPYQQQEELDAHEKKSLLNTDIGESGGRMSVGQKQLLCAARAFIKKPQILFLDEATANVDPETDQLLQRVIRTECAGVTIITIAHRLHTIMDYDRVIVLSFGKLIEDGAPEELMSRGQQQVSESQQQGTTSSETQGNGEFYRMVCAMDQRRSS